jgi:hypothetical protein
VDTSAITAVYGRGWRINGEGMHNKGSIDEDDMIPTLVAVARSVGFEDIAKCIKMMALVIRPDLYRSVFHVVTYDPHCGVSNVSVSHDHGYTGTLLLSPTSSIK